MSRTSTVAPATFQADVAVQFLGAQRPGAGVQSDAGVGGDQNLIIHASGVGVGSGQQVRLNIHAVAVLVVIHLNFVGVQNRIHHHRIVQTKASPKSSHKDSSPKRPALGPTVKWNSFLLSATSVPATITPIATSFAVRLLTISDSPKLLADPLSP